MNYAVVDLGTNSARLMIAKSENADVNTVYKTLRTIRIGEGMTQTGRIADTAMQRAKTALQEFSSISRQYGAKEFYCFATSAVREAGNSNEFLDFIRDQCGIDIEVISGDMEAHLGFAGAVQGYGGMIDIGGGSTEVMTGSIDDVNYRQSFKIGTVRCHQLFPGGDDADQPSFSKAHRFAEEAFSAVKNENGYEFTGIGGTATALAAIDLQLKEYSAERVQGHIITIQRAQQLCGMLKSMTKEQRKGLTGLEENRADVIVFGSIILLEFMRAIGSKSITVSDRDNQEGYLLKKLNLI